MLSRIQNILRGCLLSYGVTRNGKLAVVEPVPQTPVVTSPSDVASVADSDDCLSVWEQDRANTLQDADENAQQGFRHLTKAALLRLVVQFEDEGMFTVVHELRTQIDALERKTDVEVPFAQPAF